MRSVRLRRILADIALVLDDRTRITLVFEDVVGKGVSRPISVQVFLIKSSTRFKSTFFNLRETLTCRVVVNAF